METRAGRDREVRIACMTASRREPIGRDGARYARRGRSEPRLGLLGGSRSGDFEERATAGILEDKKLQLVSGTSKSGDIFTDVIIV